MKIIGITGHFGAGKDTVCDCMLSILRTKQWKRIGFADAIKVNVAKRLGITVEGLENIKYEPVIRMLLQKEGEDVNKWNGILIDELSKDERMKYNYIIPDVRYILNVRSLQDYFSEVYLVRVERKGYKGNEHKSEQEQEKIKVNYHIYNDNTKLKLYNECKNILKFLRLI